MKWKKIKPK